MAIDWQGVRGEFPALAECAWLNTATFGQVPRRAQAAVARYFEHTNRLAGRDFLQWFDVLDALRAEVASLFAAQPADVAFIPHTAFALSMLVSGIDWAEGDEVVTFDKEFPNQIYAAALLAERGVRLVRAGIDEWEAALNERTRLVALSQTNYATGRDAPVEEITAKARSWGAFVYVDGTQTAGARHFDFSACEPDLYAVNAYKWMNSPPGAGYMLVPERTRKWLRPSVVGWRSDRNWRNVNHLHDGDPSFAETAERYEGGMLPFMNLYAMRESIGLLTELGVKAVEERVLRLANLVRNELRAVGASPLGEGNTTAYGHIVAARLPGVDPGEVARAMEEANVLISARSGFLRVAPHYFNNESDIERFAAVLRKALGRE